LIDIHEDVQTEEYYLQGVILSWAFHDPKELEQLKPRPKIDYSKLPAMLRPVYPKDQKTPADG
jgi:hypothetical protein